MNALVFTQAGSPAQVLSLAELPQPQPQNYELLIEVKARPIQPADEFYIRGIYRRAPVFPAIAGLEGAGVVVGRGAAVTHIQVGDHVSFRWPGTWADYILVPQDQVVAVPPSMPFAVACQLCLNPTTAWGLLAQAALQPGQTMVVTAANSAVGRLLIQLAALRGLRTICLVRDTTAEAALLGLGASQVLAADLPNLPEHLRELTGGAGVHAVLDVVGGQLLTQLLPVVAPFGRILLYGASAPEAAAIFNRTIVYGNLSLQGFGIDHWLGSQSAEYRRQVYQQLIELLQAGRLQASPTAPFALADFRVALAAPGEHAKRILY